MSNYTELCQELRTLAGWLHEEEWSHSCNIAATAADAIEALQRENAATEQQVEILSDALAESRREIEVIRGNAARYEWLRNNWFTMSSNYYKCITFSINEKRWSDFSEVALDAAIDAAIQNEGPKDD